LHELKSDGYRIHSSGEPLLGEPIAAGCVPDYSGFEGWTSPCRSRKTCPEDSRDEGESSDAMLAILHLLGTFVVKLSAVVAGMADVHIAERDQVRVQRRIERAASSSGLIGKPS
jgi:hypothetical protein